MATITLYDQLGVNKDADAQTIKHAYRKKARKAHPDHGGQNGEFIALQKAYSILNDPSKRRRYDETGQTEQKSIGARALQHLTRLFCSLISATPDIEHCDLLARAKDEMDAQRKKVTKQQADAQKLAKRFATAAERLTCSQPENVLGTILEQQATKLERDAQSYQDFMDELTEMERQLAAYQYRKDEDRAEDIVNQFWGIRFTS